MEGLVLSDILKDLILNILNILILFLIVKTLAYKPVKKFLDDRKARIDEQLTEAAKQKEEAQAIQKSYEELIRRNEEKGSEIIRQASEKARAEAEEITKLARRQAEETKQKAIEDAKKANRTATIAMKDEITDLAFDISGKILSREVTDEDNRRLAEAFFENYRAE